MMEQMNQRILMICDFPISLAEGEVLELCVVDQVTIQWETQAISAIQTMTEVLEGATSGGNVPGAKTTHSYQFGQSLSGRLFEFRQTPIDPKADWGYTLKARFFSEHDPKCKNIQPCDVVHFAKAKSSECQPEQAA